MRISVIGISLVIIGLLYSNFIFARDYNRSLCNHDGFYCIHIKRGQSWHSLWPDDHDRDIVMRINRMNTSIYPGQVIAVPERLSNSDVMEFSPFPRRIPSIQEKLIIFDPWYQAWGAYDESGSLVRWGPASGGSDWCRDLGKPCHTRSGYFRIQSLGSSECISHKFPIRRDGSRGGAPMPYCMYFNSGQAFHGEPNGLPGYNASHGCVRLYVSDAEWLRYDFVEPPNANNDYQGTKVIVRPYLHVK
jgi:hypothetical protein